MPYTQRDRYRGHRFYRDPERGIIKGVYAGLARSFDANLTVVRVIAVIAGLIFPVASVLTYIIAAILMRPMPRY